MEKPLQTNVVNEIIRPWELQRICGLSRTTIWRLEKEGKFVQKIRLTQHAIGYRRTDIERWLEERTEIGGENIQENN